MFAGAVDIAHVAVHFDCPDASVFVDIDCYGVVDEWFAGDELYFVSGL